MWVSRPTQQLRAKADYSSAVSGTASPCESALRANLDKFRKHVISFSQDMWSLAQREGMQQHYKVEDHVNSVRGPGNDPDRVPMLACDAPVCKQKSSGPVSVPPAVKRVARSGVYSLEFDDVPGEVGTASMDVPADVASSTNVWKT